MTSIHPTALVDPAAQLDDGVSIGPYSIIGPQVQIGAGTTVGPHVVIEGRVMVFGTKKLKNLGSDLGGAVKGFKDGMKDGTGTGGEDAATAQVTQQNAAADSNTIDVEAKNKS